MVVEEAPPVPVPVSRLSSYAQGPVNTTTSVQFWPLKAFDILDFGITVAFAKRGGTATAVFFLCLTGQNCIPVPTSPKRKSPGPPADEAPKPPLSQFVVPSGVSGASEEPSSSSSFAFVDALRWHSSPPSSVAMWSSTRRPEVLGGMPEQARLRPQNCKVFCLGSWAFTLVSALAFTLGWGLGSQAGLGF